MNSDGTFFLVFTFGFLVSSDSMYCDLTIADYDTVEVGSWSADEHQFWYTAQDSLGAGPFDYLLNSSGDTLRITVNEASDTLHIYLEYYIKINMEIVR